MSITIEQLDNIVHLLNEDIGGSELGYLVSLDSTGYTYFILLNGFTLYDPDLHSIDEDGDTAYQIERICRDNLLKYCNFWEECRVRIYATRKDRLHPMAKDEDEHEPLDL